jgi:predicted nucleic acid-binding protein
MLVISDASPLNVLIRIERVALLPKLFNGIVIPPAVEAELNDPRAPKEVRDFLRSGPSWLEVASPLALLDLPSIGPGERAAISLAHERKADLLLIDDKRGRRAAKTLDLRIIGTIGILELMAAQGWLNVKDALDRIREIGFSASD